MRPAPASPSNIVSIRRIGVVMYIVEYEKPMEPVVGVPRLEDSGGAWHKCAPAIFETRAEAENYMEGLTLHYAAALQNEHAAFLRWFRVQHLSHSEAINLPLLSQNRYAA